MLTMVLKTTPLYQSDISNKTDDVPHNVKSHRLYQALTYHVLPQPHSTELSEYEVVLHEVSLKVSC